MNIWITKADPVASMIGRLVSNTYLIQRLSPGIKFDLHSNIIES